MVTSFVFPHAADIGLFLLRLTLGVIFWAHGALKRPLWKAQPSEQLPKQMLYIIRTLSIAEPAGAIAIVLGLLSPLPLIGFTLVMIGAISLHRKMNVAFVSLTTTGWEIDFIVLLISLSLLLTGPGMFSLDHYLAIG